MQDSLMPLAQYMHYALGSDHAVTVMLQRLADANLSSATKRRQQEEQKLLEVEIVELSCPIVRLCSAERALPDILTVSCCASLIQMAMFKRPLGSAVIQQVGFFFFCCFYELLLFETLQICQIHDLPCPQVSSAPLVVDQPAVCLQ